MCQTIVYGIIVVMLLLLLVDDVETFKAGFLDIFTHMNVPVHMLSFMSTDAGVKRVYIGGSPKNGESYETYYLSYHDCSFNISKDTLKEEFEHYTIVMREIDKRTSLGYTMFIRAKGKTNQVYVDDKGLLYLKKDHKTNPPGGVPIEIDIMKDTTIDKGGFIMKRMGTDNYFVITQDGGKGTGLIGFYGTRDEAMIVYFTDVIKEMLSDTRFCE